MNANGQFSRRGFLAGGSALIAAPVLGSEWKAPERNTVRGGFDEVAEAEDGAAPWVPYSDRKVRVGIAGEGVCSFGSQFSYQTHPNAEVVACADVQPDRLKLLQERVRAPKAYASCEEMIRHAAADRLEAVYIATDAPSHVKLAIMALEHGLHVTSAVPALLGTDQLEYVPRLVDAVKRSGRVYQMNETTAFRASCHEMRKLYEAGLLGDIVYSEGEYWHCSDLKSGLGVGSYGGWRDGLPPMFYPTHSTGFYACVTHRRFTEVTCVGKPSRLDIYRENGRHNRYRNPFGGEFAYFKTEEGGTSRMLVSYDIPCVNGERGRVWGQLGGYDDEHLKFLGDEKQLKGLDYRRHKLPQGVEGGGHGGSHGYLTDDFLHAILDPKHRPCVDVVTALNLTVAGIYAHLSALKDGEMLKVPAVA